MPLIFALIGVIFFLVFILMAVKFGVSEKKLEDEVDTTPVIHTSGIYSIIHKSPREDIESYKPTLEELKQYLTHQNVDTIGNKLSDEIKKDLLNRWYISVEDTIAEIEGGDINGVEFYYYSLDNNCVCCEELVKKGRYITRQEIFKYPEILPPFHIGCKYSLKCHKKIGEISDQTNIALTPFLENGILPQLPNWRQIVI